MPGIPPGIMEGSVPTIPYARPNLRIDLTLAPLHGVTNWIFRKAYFHHFPGMDKAMAPFIASVNPAKPTAHHFKDLLPEVNQVIPLVPQILGNDATEFVATTKILADLGYAEVNWNLGCPFSMVAKKRRGSGLLPFPDLIEGFLGQACPRLCLPLSVKLRLGRKDPQDILDLMPILNSFPLKLVYIHPRVGTQMYRGEVDLDGFAAASRLCSHEVAYNGDIKDLRTFEMLRSRFPTVREWMIGRWAIFDPFLPGRIKGGPVATGRRGILQAFHDELYADYRKVLFGPAHVMDKMKEVWTFIGKSFPNCEQLLARIAQAKTLVAYERAVDRVFSR